MDVKKIIVLLAISICWLSCSDSHTEPGENENPNNNTTIYDLFPEYNKYDNLYHVAGGIELQNISTKQLKIFPAVEAGLLLKENNLEWEIPNNAPYLYCEHFGAIRLIMTNEVCYKEVLKIFPNYMYYECLLGLKNKFELENIATKEIKQYDQISAEKQLRNPNPEWKIPKNAPYVLDFAGSYGLHLYRISEMCRALSAK